jgi:hypothetical protein
MQQQQFMAGMQQASAQAAQATNAQNRRSNRGSQPATLQPPLLQMSIQGVQQANKPQQNARK